MRKIKARESSWIHPDPDSKRQWLLSGKFMSGEYFPNSKKNEVSHECKVCDCVVHSSVRTITERIPEYRTLLIGKHDFHSVQPETNNRVAIVLDHADSYHNWSLSRGG